MMGRSNAECIIVDIDGTLANLIHRLKYIEGPGKKDWDSFYEALSEDEPLQDMINIVDALSYQYLIILCSGRPENYRQATKEWLSKNHIFYDDLFMRKEGDYRQDYIIKKELLDKIREKYTVIAAIDDRKQVVDMWRDNGILCLQCAEGDF